MAFKEVDAGREAELSCVRFGGGNCSWSLQECRCTSLHEEESSRNRNCWQFLSWAVEVLCLPPAISVQGKQLGYPHAADDAMWRMMSRSEPRERTLLPLVICPL